MGQILNAFATLNHKMDLVMATLKDIADAETAESAAIQSVLTEISDLQGELVTAQANGADPAQIQVIVDQIHANTAKLTAALPPPVTKPTDTTIPPAPTAP